MPLHRTTEQDYEKHKKKSDQVFLKAGTELLFEMDSDGFGERVQFITVLKDDLYVSKRGNKEWKLDYCPCLLIAAKTVFREINLYPDPIETLSLNQLFTKVSIKYRPNKASHNCNVFKVFRVAKTGVLLDNLRKQLEE